MDGIDERRYSCMVKRGVSNGSHNGRGFSLHLMRMIEPGGLADRRPHAETGIDSSEVQSQRVTPDVARIDPLRQCPTDRVECRPMTTARAEGGSPGLVRNDLLRLCRDSDKSLDTFHQNIRDEFSLRRYRPVQSALDEAAHGKLHLDHRVGFFNDENYHRTKG